MLRVHPVLHTPDVPGAIAFLEALGLTAAEVPAVDSRTADSTAAESAVLDAGSGRVTVRACSPDSPGAGRTSLTFDVGDVREFARRTVEAGSAVEVSGEGPHTTAHVAAPGGTTFPAVLGPRDTGATAPLTVVARWHTTAFSATARVLEDIGAKPRETPAPGDGHVQRAKTYLAKNGGVVTVLAADRTEVELAFEYDGDVRELLGRLTAAGLEPVVLDGPSGRSLEVAAPWGARVRIDGTPADPVTAGEQ